jgi:hypothetical protein
MLTRGHGHNNYQKLMEMDWTYPQKKPNDTTKIALYRTPEEKRKRGRPKVTWRRTVEAEIKHMEEIWNSL